MAIKGSVGPPPRAGADLYLYDLIPVDVITISGKFMNFRGECNRVCIHSHSPEGESCGEKSIVNRIRSKWVLLPSADYLITDSIQVLRVLWSARGISRLRESLM